MKTKIQFKICLYIFFLKDIMLRVALLLSLLCGAVSDHHVVPHSAVPHSAVPRAAYLTRDVVQRFDPGRPPTTFLREVPKVLAPLHDGPHRYTCDGNACDRIIDLVCHRGNTLKWRCDASHRSRIMVRQPSVVCEATKSGRVVCRVTVQAIKDVLNPIESLIVVLSIIFLFALIGPVALLALFFANDSVQYSSWDDC